MENAKSTEEYAGESVPTYDQTEESLDSQNRVRAEHSTPAETTISAPNTRWTYHNLDSSLLEFLCFLADHEVVVAKAEDLHHDDQSSPASGTFMQVFRGHWKETPVVLKYPMNTYLASLDGSARDLQEDELRLEQHRKLHKNLVFEIQIMSHPHLNQHRNIAKLLAVAFKDFISMPKGNDSSQEGPVEEVFLPILVVEPAITAHPTLDQYFQVHSKEPISIERASSFVCDISSGLVAIHLHGIVHGDIKDTNILLFEEVADHGKRLVAKIADFGSAGIDTIREDIRGKSPYWAAPEVLERPKGWSGLRRTVTADVYSFGLLAATIALNGRKVFDTGVDVYVLKFDKDEACDYIKTQLERSSPSFASNSVEERGLYLSALEELMDHTVRSNVADRWSNLSTVPQLFGKGDEPEYINLIHDIIPFHTYGTFNHRGVRALAPQVANKIYSQLPTSIKHNLAWHLHRFQNASTDSQTLLVFLTLKMKEELELLDFPDDLISKLINVRLSRPSPPQTPAPVECDKSEVGGFEQAYKRHVLINGESEPLILRAVSEGDLDRAKQMIADDSKVRQAVIGNGWNGLHYAAYFKRAEFMPIFLEEPDAVPVDSVGGKNHRYTALHESAWQADPNCVRTLIEHGGDVNKRSTPVGDFSFTPLFLCVKEDIVDAERTAETVRLLLKAGASTEFRHVGLGIAHLLVRRKRSATALRVLLEHDHQLVHQLTPNKQTPLFTAAQIRNLDAIDVLLSFGASINARDIRGDTPLHYAYISIGPSIRPSSNRYSEHYVSKLVGGIEDAGEIIQLLVHAGADEDALGNEDLPWDTPESRMFHEEEDAFEVTISPAKWFTEELELIPESWTVKEWEGSDLGACAIFTPGRGTLDLCYDLGLINPNYYELQIRLAVIDGALPSLSISSIIYTLEESDDAVISLMSKISLGQLETNRVYTIKLRNLIVKHRKDFKLRVFEKKNLDPDTETAQEGKILLDWIHIRKNTFTEEGHSFSEEIVGL